MIAMIRCADPNTERADRDDDASAKDGKPCCGEESNDVLVVVVERENADEEGYDG